MIAPNGSDVRNLPVEPDVCKPKEPSHVAEPLFHRPFAVEIDVERAAAPAVAGEDVEQNILPLLPRPHPPDAGQPEPTVDRVRPRERPVGGQERGIANHLGPIERHRELLLGDPPVVLRDEVHPSGAAVGVGVHPPQAVVGPVGLRRLLTDDHVWHPRCPTDVREIDRADPVVGAPLRHHRQVGPAQTQLQRQPEVARMEGRAREARKKPVDRIGHRLLESADAEAAEADSRPPQRLPSRVERSPGPRAAAGRADMEAPALKGECRIAPQFLAPAPEERAGGEKHHPPPRQIISLRGGTGRIVHGRHANRSLGHQARKTRTRQSTIFPRGSSTGLHGRAA